MKTNKRGRIIWLATASAMALLFWVATSKRAPQRTLYIKPGATPTQIKAAVLREIPLGTPRVKVKNWLKNNGIDFSNITLEVVSFEDQRKTVWEEWKSRAPWLFRPKSPIYRTDSTPAYHFKFDKSSKLADICYDDWPGHGICEY